MIAERSSDNERRPEAAAAADGAEHDPGRIGPAAGRYPRGGQQL